RHPLADDNAHAKPDIFADTDRAVLLELGRAVIGIVPVRIRDVAPAGDHRVAANGNVFRRNDVSAGADENVIADLDLPLALAGTPCGQANEVSARRVQMKMRTRRDARAPYLDIARAGYVGA